MPVGRKIGDAALHIEVGGDSGEACTRTVSIRRITERLAAMRRFAFKVAFDYSGPEQILALYQALLAPLVTKSDELSASSAAESFMLTQKSDKNGPDLPLPDKLAAELKNLSSLAPGDFHAVRARARFSPQGRLSHADLIAELKQELAGKLERAGRRIGFDR